MLKLSPLSLGFLALGLLGASALTSCDRSTTPYPPVQPPPPATRPMTPPPSPPKRAPLPPLPKVSAAERTRNLANRAHWVKQQTPSEGFKQWRVDHEFDMLEFEQFLKQNHADQLVPAWQLTASVRDWQKCNAEPHSLAPRELWETQLKPLGVLRELVERGILTRFTVTSTYRDPVVNSCVGGSKGSKHMLNGALDIRLDITEDDVPTARQAMCQFWEQRGADLQLGLGLYQSGQIHLDREGYRTWGPDYSRYTSPCWNPF